MPNGQTDVFRLGRAAWLEILAAHPDAALPTIDMRTGETAATPVAVIATWTRRAPGSEVLVEEQHGASYLVHIGPDWRYWVTIDPDSAVYREIRRRHYDAKGRSRE